MSEVAELMKRCQRGVGGRNALDEAHDIMAECYGTLGRLESERDALEAENARFQSAIVGMIDLAHEYRHLLTRQRFPDNDEGDAFRRHRDAQVARIKRILSAAHAAKVKP